jgi:hypothetical protein
MGTIMTTIMITTTLTRTEGPTRATLSLVIPSVERGTWVGGDA